MIVGERHHLGDYLIVTFLCVVVKQKENKRRRCIDYSQSVNPYTELEVFSLPRIDELINHLSKYRLFSKYGSELERVLKLSLNGFGASASFGAKS